MSLIRLAQESLQKFGEYVSLAFEGRQYTNLDQDRAACRLAHVLERLGVEPGDRVMVMLPNCPEVIQSYGAILKVGAVIVPVIFLLGGREVGHILADSEAAVVITSSDMLWKVERQIRGGFNIYPREVEETLYAFPKVAEAAVVGMADPLMGEEVLAFVVLKDGTSATADEVVAFCRARLARFKCPKQVRFVDSLPKSPIGKILRKELRGRV